MGTDFYFIVFCYLMEEWWLQNFVNNSESKGPEWCSAVSMWVCGKFLMVLLWVVFCVAFLIALSKFLIVLREGIVHISVILCARFSCWYIVWMTSNWMCSCSSSGAPGVCKALFTVIASVFPCVVNCSAVDELIRISIPGLHSFLPSSKARDGISSNPRIGLWFDAQFE